MHYLPDTEEQDIAAERYWPDGFKQVIREEVERAVRLKLNEKRLGHIYIKQYQDKYADAGQFANRIAEKVIIGAENGADAGFEVIFKAFLTESPLPEIARYAVYLWPYIFRQKIIDRIQNAVAFDYRNDETFKYAFNVGYQKEYLKFDEFIDQIACKITISVINGTDDMLARIYTAFLNWRPLPPARRNPKRLKIY
jgi:hypothetical protein